MKTTLLCLLLLAVAVFGDFHAPDPALQKQEEITAYEVVSGWKFDGDRLSFEAYNRHWQFIMTASNFTNVRGKYYRGDLIGAEDTHASFTICDHEISGLVMSRPEGSTGARMWFVEQVKHVALIKNKEGLDPEAIVMYAVSDVYRVDMGVSCGMKKAPTHIHDKHSDTHLARTRRGTKSLAVYIDTLYQGNGGPDVGGLVNDINTVYTASGVPPFELNFVGSVDFAASEDISSALNTFANYVAQRLAQHSTFDNVHLLTGQPYGFNGGGTVGLGYAGTTCAYATGQYTQYKTGVSALYPSNGFNRPAMIQLIAHELGHNRSPGLPQPCANNDCFHDYEGGGCYVMAPSLCDYTGGVVFRPSWAARMC